MRYYDNLDYEQKRLELLKVYFNLHLISVENDSKVTIFLPIVLKRLKSYLLMFRIVFQKQTILIVLSMLLLINLDIIFEGDEPLYEPIEWSIIQTWLLLFVLISWIGENLILSFVGKFTAKDKRVWFGWYKILWVIELFYLGTLGITIFLIITPFYFELVYLSSYIMTFWNWLSKTFFAKNILLLTLLIYFNLFFQLNFRFIFYKKFFLNIFFNITVFSYLFFIQFYMFFFSYFTDNTWYTKTKTNSLIQLSHEPWKWAWDSTKRDHFSYHQSKTVFWFKNDGPFAECLFLLNLYYLLSVFIILIMWFILFFKTLSIKQISYTYTIFTFSFTRQFLFFFYLFYVLIIGSIGIIYLKTPVELTWIAPKYLLLDQLLVWFYL